MNHKSYRADDRSYYALIKKDIHKLVVDAGFNHSKIDAVDLVISEITSNLYKHANGGELLVGIGTDSDKEYVEIISIDDGPGISDIGKVLMDGYSSTQTLGHGLGSIRRFSDNFDFYSLKGWGTILLSRIYNEPISYYSKKRFDLQGLNIPKPGEEVSGDGYCLRATTDGFRLLIADGLGHGKDANLAVREASKAFSICPEDDPAETIRFLHTAIRKTRGIVGTVIFFDSIEKKWTSAGVGNISGKWMDNMNNRSFNAYNGIIGLSIPGTINNVVLGQDEWPSFIACSDGMRSRWDISKFPLIQRHNGSVIAAAIYKEFGRRTDDMSVLVCKTF